MRSVSSILLAGLSTVAAASKFNCLPGQACWPSPEEWSNFNSSINGRLFLTQHMNQPCYENADSETCGVVQDGYRDFEFRTFRYGARQQVNFETCAKQGCRLNSTEPRLPIDDACRLGRLSAFYVEAHEANDVEKTLKFVNKHKLRLSIKNSGHDYLGRSSLPNSLAIWTFNMKHQEYNSKFTLTNTYETHDNIGVIGAGISAKEAYEFFELHNMYVVVGAVNGVGIAGGFGQVGGHGALTPSVGLMVDQAVEFDVVTADGEFLSINEHNYPDLFWAMRGGGGSSYAVLVSYKCRVHPRKPLQLFSYRGTLNTPATNIPSSSFHRDIVTAIAANSTQWADKKIATYNWLTQSGFQSVLVHVGDDAETFKAATASWSALLKAYPGTNVTHWNYATVQKWTEYAAYVKPFEVNSAIGLSVLEASRLIPRTLFEEPESMQRVIDAYLEGMQISVDGGARGVAHIYGTVPAHTPDAEHKTSANRLWRGALWHALFPTAYTSSITDEGLAALQNTISSTVNPLKELLEGGGGSYGNEADYNEENWQQTFWGEDYDGLLEVKKKYDPESVFTCYKCVGMEESDPFFNCWSLDYANQTATIPVNPIQGPA